MVRAGDSYKDILLYWLPELVTVALLIYAPPLIDLYLIAGLKSTTTLGALSAANNFLHTLLKFAEALPVAAIAVIGRHNGAKQYKRVGADLGDAFWTSLLIGTVVFFALYFNAGAVYRWLDVPERMVTIGVPFLRLRAFGTFLSFVFIAFLGFLRGVKNTRVPMFLNIVGTLIFVLFDYALVLGKWGCTPLHLTGSAIATIVQYSVMIVIAVAYIMFNPEYKKYFATAFYTMFSAAGAYRLLNLSWPIMVDKTSLSIAYLWLFKMMASMGKYVIASFEVVKQLERIAFLPALAFASIVAFLVSNRLGAEDFEGARANIQKVILLALGFVGVGVVLVCFNAESMVRIFDPRGKFVDFAAPIVPIVSTLIVFDLVQVILASALRGAGDVRTVMWGRFLVVTLFFLPVSYTLAHMTSLDPSTRFTLLYGSFYVSNAIMGFIFLRRILGSAWQHRQLD